MNKKLHDYVRSVSFNISLSARQIEVLLLIHKYGYSGYLKAFIASNSSHGVVQLRKLEHFGLISREPLHESGSVPPSKGLEITKAGALVGDLLLEAGYEIQEYLENAAAA